MLLDLWAHDFGRFQIRILFTTGTVVSAFSFLVTGRVTGMQEFRLAFKNKCFSESHFVSTATVSDRVLQGRVGVVHTRSSQSENAWIVAYLPPCTGTVTNSRIAKSVLNYIRPSTHKSIAQ